MRNEMFICGVFSLLDRLMRQPFDELLKNVPVPEQVQSTLLGNGPFVPALDLVRALEQSSLADIRDNSERMLTSSAEVNRALLAALTSARQLS
jgi:EAL and modified HD-GYP domain-containing signal transduction protein